MSGRLSSCSVVQEEYLVKRMHKTPGTPIKSGYHTTPRKSERKRSLFQSSTADSDSEDLGHMSPLSSSSCGSPQSLPSPHFSPNGKLRTPPMTPTCMGLIRNSPRLSAKRLEVKSTLFPQYKNFTPRVIMATPQKSPQKDVRMVPETDSSPSTVCLTPVDKPVAQTVKPSPKVTKLGFKTLSSESFYGPPPPQTNKARTCLFIDTLEPKIDADRHRRSLSKESCSNRSFVTGSGGRRRTSSAGSNQNKRSKNSRRGPTIPGVWHNIKKPKNMKKPVRAVKPLVSPEDRLLGNNVKSTKDQNSKDVKPRLLFEDKPRKRLSKSIPKKRLYEQMDDEGIIDSFPDHLIKRKRLPSYPVSDPKQINVVKNCTPDPNKKFMKYGCSKKATLTLSRNVKLQISENGILKLQSPKKKHRLFTRKDVIVDFNDDDDDGHNDGLKADVRNILDRLDKDKEFTETQIRQLKSPCKVQIKKISDAQLLGILESPSTTINFIEQTPSKTLTEISSSPNNKIVRNLSSLMIDEAEKENAAADVRNSSFDDSQNGLTTTGSMISYSTKLLFGNDMESGEMEDSPSKEEDKLFSLFYKENWNKSPNKMTDITNMKSYSNKKKTPKVPDDQYLLDAGQKSIGIVTCGKCGVMYQAGDFVDEAVHKNFHNRLPELRFSGWSNERVVGRYSDGRVIKIHGKDPKAWWHKVEKIVEIVDQELGFPEMAVNDLFYKKVYLYVNDKAKQIAGCLVTEECGAAYKMFPPLEGMEIDSCSKDPSPCRVGVSRIWTALPHRRRGVASRLIECMQRTFVFGEIVPMDMVAFSVPSPSGKMLAQKVTGKLDFLVYGFA